MRIIKCRILNKIECSDSVEELITRDELRLDLDEETLLIFETEPGVRVVCSGNEYQFHQWGFHTYQLWLLNKGLNTCLFLKNANFVEIIEKTILVKRSDEEVVMDPLIIGYVNGIASKRGLIVLLSKSIRDDYCFKNIVSYSSLNNVSKCLEKLLNHEC